jgi:hypothetical protein
LAPISNVRNWVTITRARFLLRVAISIKPALFIEKDVVIRKIIERNTEVVNANNAKWEGGGS